MNILSMFLLFIIYSIKKCYTISKRYISLPFNIQEESSYTSQNYNKEIFIQNNFYKNITYKFYIGNPPKIVDGIILNDNKCFEMKIPEDLEKSKRYLKSTNNKYLPKESSSFSLLHKKLRWTKDKYMTLGSDFFNFDKSEKDYNLTFLLNQSEKDNIDLNLIKNQKYIIKFGLNIQTGYSGDECPNFLYYTRAKAGLSKYIISYIFKNSKEGFLIVGDELYNYNPKIYNESFFKGVYTFKYNSLNHDKEIIFDSFNNKNISLNKSDAYIEYKYGVIIGTNHYKEYINEIFFNKKISENICNIELVKINETSQYYIYICKNNVNLDKFPKLIFFSRSYAFNFELDQKDLFIKKFDNNIYFLVLFRSDNKGEDNWILGGPFFKKYTFSFNIDAKIIGFYNKIINEDNSEENYPRNKPESNKSIVYIFIIIVIVILLLMLLSFYCGMKLKAVRKKRANELKEDNYEYFPELDKENNKIIN